MTLDGEETTERLPGWQKLACKDVLAGLLFMAIAVFGLVVSRKYPVGTTLQMGTGYMPRLLCWILLGLGACILVQGLRVAKRRQEQESGSVLSWVVPLLLVTASLVFFGLTIERLGLVVAILLLIGIGSLAARTLRPVETLAAALVLILLSWLVFILGLGLTIPVWPEW